VEACKVFETLRNSHGLDSRLTDGGKFVSLRRRPPLYFSETLFLSLIHISVREGY
jgi:hypothetical protein